MGGVVYRKRKASPFRAGMTSLCLIVRQRLKSPPSFDGVGLNTGKDHLLKMPSPGQFLGNEERRPIPPAIPGEDTKEIELNNRRTNVVRLLPNGFQERKLRRLADTSAKLFNEINYERRQQFFHEGRVDLKGTHEVLWEV